MWKIWQFGFGNAMGALIALNISTMYMVHARGLCLASISYAVTISLLPPSLLQVDPAVWEDVIIFVFSAFGSIILVQRAVLVHKIPNAPERKKHMVIIPTVYSIVYI
jgi:hypothetical protein